MSDHRKIGNRGEDIAAQYLNDNGYKIVKRNFHFGRQGEIDIIAEKDQCLIFIEVKMRSNNEYGEPVESMSARKRNSWRKAAEGYLYVNKKSDIDCRFDFIAIDSSTNPPKIKHIKNAM